MTESTADTHLAARHLRKLLREGAVLVREEAGRDDLAQWANRAALASLATYKTRSSLRRARQRTGKGVGMPPDFPAGSARPISTWRANCFGCRRRRSKVSFSGPAYCVTCGQNGRHNGWCACGSPVVSNGVCKRSGSRCKLRGTVAVFVETPIAQRIGERVKARRTELGLSVAELGRRCGVLSPNVHRVEAGAHVPGTLTLMRLATALDMSVDRLLGSEAKV